MRNKAQTELVKGLGVFGATSVVAGTMIGTAIFVVPGIMLQQVGTPAMVLVVFVAAGILSLFGALSLCRARRGAAGGGRRIRLHAPRLRPPVRIPLRLDAIHHRQDRLDCRYRHGFCHLPRLLLPALARNRCGELRSAWAATGWNCA